MRLVMVELNRFWSRRAVALLLLTAALLMAALAGFTIWESRPVSPSDRAAAERVLERELERPFYQRDVARCERNPDQLTGRGSTTEQCVAEITPPLRVFLAREPLSLAREQVDSGLVALMLVGAVMIIVGTTFAGADWATGSLSNQLLFEPRRNRVWWAKGAAAFLATLVASAVLLAAFWCALYVTAQIRDIPTDGAVLRDIGWTVGRGVLLAASGALGAFALTMLVRHTVGTLAVLFAYALGGEALTASLPIANAGQWSLTNNVLAWIRDGTRYFDDSIVCPGGQVVCRQEALLTLTDAATYLGVLLLVVVVFSTATFWRRDVP